MYILEKFFTRLKKSLEKKNKERKKLFTWWMKIWLCEKNIQFPKNNETFLNTSADV